MKGARRPAQLWLVSSAHHAPDTRNSGSAGVATDVDRRAGSQLVNNDRRWPSCREPYTAVTVIGVWFAVLVVVAGAGARSGVSITIGISALWFVACVVPPAVMLMVWRGAPPPTVAEILHAVDQRD